MSIIQGTARVSGDASFYDFPIGQSLRFDGSSHLTRTPASAGNLQTWTLSFWVQRTRIGTDYIINVRESSAQQNLAEFFLGFRADLFRVIDANPTRVIVDVTGKIRDLSAWYHYVIVWNTPDPNQTSRIKIYKNGILQTFTSEAATLQYPSQYDNITHFNSPQKHTIGHADFYGGSASYQYYLAEFNFLDGYVPTTSNGGIDSSGNLQVLGEFKNGLWIPKNPSGLSYGTNGFRLSFASSDFNTSGSAITDPHGSSTNVPDGYVADASGSGNHWNVN